jgi:RHS repeat-associated protein
VAEYTPGISERRGGVSTFYHADIKSGVVQTGSSGSVSGRRAYDAFGNVVGSTGVWQGPFSYGGPFGYQTDGDSGLLLLGHRYYDPSLGRFLSRDPIKDGGNWYAYCANNPITYADPQGLIFETILDIGGFIYDAAEFVRSPSWGSGLRALWSLGSIFIPGVPGSWIARGIAWIKKAKPEIWARANKGRTLREKLKIFTGVTDDAIKGMDAHHIIPKRIWDRVKQKFNLGDEWDEWFNSALNGMWWASDSHRRLWKVYEEQLLLWLKNHPHATFAQFLEAAKDIARGMGAVG